MENIIKNSFLIMTIQNDSFHFLQSKRIEREAVKKRHHSKKQVLGEILSFSYNKHKQQKIENQKMSYNQRKRY